MSKVYFRLVIIFFMITISYAEELVFTHGNHILSGQYLEQINGKSAKAFILFVHGDGAMSYNAEGFYDLIWQTLREEGYAIFSWDKPNVGKSTGNWLNQSMEDRQSEVLAAIDAVQEKYKFTSKNTGLMGFSQAGWVVPALGGSSNKLSFIIGIGFATNWIDQGYYFTKTKHILAGESNKQIEQALETYTKEIEFFKKSPSYADLLDFAGPQAMSQERYEFILKNFQSDATEDIESIKVPSLILWGENDLNVDAQYEFESWQKYTNVLITTKLISHASHGMFKSEIFDTQMFGLKQWLKMMWFKEKALAVEFLPTVIQWLEEKYK